MGAQGCGQGAHRSCAVICNKGSGRSERRRRFLLPLRVCFLCLWALLLRARSWPWSLCGCSGVWFPLLYFNKKGRIWPALREASTPQILRALYAAVSLRFGKFLISDPGVSLFGILPHFGSLRGGTSVMGEEGQERSHGHGSRRPRAKPRLSQRRPCCRDGGCGDMGGAKNSRSSQVAFRSWSCC